MVELLCVVGGLAAGASLRWLWPRTVVAENVSRGDSTMTAIAEKLLEDDALKGGSSKRFRVVAHTDDGATARRIFETADPNMDTTMVFWDGDKVRGLRQQGKKEK